MIAGPSVLVVGFSRQGRNVAESYCVVESRGGQERFTGDLARLTMIAEDLCCVQRSLFSVSFGGKNTQSVLFPLLCKVRAVSSCSVHLQFSFMYFSSSIGGLNLNTCIRFSQHSPFSVKILWCECEP